MISHVFRRGRLMFTLSKTVEIAIMCSTALFAQNNMTDSAKIKASKVTQLKYIFSGINLTPHLGFFCAF